MRCDVASQKLQSARLKVERAKKHILELGAALQAFFSSSPYATGWKRDPQTRKPILHVVSVKSVPTNITVIAGDVMQNLRSALDHLAYEILLASPKPDPKDRKKVYFPIFDAAGKYETGKMSKIRCGSDHAIKALDAVEPYKGGKGQQLWILHELNNIDKHRAIMTAGSALAAIDLGAIGSRRLQQMIRKQRQDQPDWPVEVPPILHAFYRTETMMGPLNAGYELYIGGVDDEFEYEMGARFDIALYEPEIIEGKSLLETANELARKVDSVLDQFTDLL
jgi:hypothetical protein